MECVASRKAFTSNLLQPLHFDLELYLESSSKNKRKKYTRLCHMLTVVVDVEAIELTTWWRKISSPKQSWCLTWHSAGFDCIFQGAILHMSRRMFVICGYLGNLPHFEHKLKWGSRWLLFVLAQFQFLPIMTLYKQCGAPQNSIIISFCFCWWFLLLNYNSEWERDLESMIIWTFSFKCITWRLNMCNRFTRF